MNLGRILSGDNLASYLAGAFHVPVEVAVGILDGQPPLAAEPTVDGCIAELLDNDPLTRPDTPPEYLYGQRHPQLSGTEAAEISAAAHDTLRALRADADNDTDLADRNCFGPNHGAAHIASHRARAAIARRHHLEDHALPERQTVAQFLTPDPANPGSYLPGPTIPLKAAAGDWQIDYELDYEPELGFDNEDRNRMTIFMEERLRIANTRPHTFTHLTSL